MEDQEQVPPSSFERQLTPEEEKAVLINFMGNTYGEVKKLDSNVVGNSTSLGNRSDGIKQHLEHVVKSNAANTPVNTPPVQAQPVQQPVGTAPVVSPPPVQTGPGSSTVNEVHPQQDDNQLTFSFDVNEKEELFTLIEKILTRLDKLHRKVDDLAESDKNSKVTSLPIKKRSKKKSVEPKEET